MASNLRTLRTTAIVGLLGIAVTHAFELPDKLEETGLIYQAVMFAALIIGCIVLAAAAGKSPVRPWWTGALLLGALPLIGYIVSRTIGLPNGQDDVGAWGDPSGIASLVFEALTIAVSARALQLLPAAAVRSRAARGRAAARA
jgi:hypothetical protein